MKLDGFYQLALVFMFAFVFGFFRMRERQLKNMIK